MNILKNTFIIIIPLLLCISMPVYSVSYIGIGETSVAGSGSISNSLTSQIGDTQKNAFLSSEPISLNFHLNIAREDIGSQSELFLLAAYNGYVFMRDQAGQWLPWNDQTPVLEAAARKKLQAQERITVLNKNKLPAGEYIIISAYRTALGDIKYSQQAVTFIVSDQSKSALHRIKSPAFLAEYLNKAQSDSRFTGAPELMSDAAFSGVVEASTAAPTAPTSQTNLQEAGVDESDSIKTSDNILFALEQCESKTNTGNKIPSDGASFIEDSSFAPYPEQNKTCLSSYRIQETPASATRLDRKELSSSGYSKGSLFLSESTASSPSSQLIWLSDSMAQEVWASWSYPGYWTSNITTVQFFDITSPEKITSTKKLTLDGALIASRRIGDQLYLITRKNHYTPVPLAESPLPKIAFDESTEKSLVAATDCYVPASRSDLPYDGTIITITTLSINNPENYQSSCVTGNIETAYVSTEGLYLATSRYPYYTFDNVIRYDQVAEYSTEIHKFAFTDNHVSYKGSGTVPGHLGWEMDKKPFRMGEHNGILKVATSLGESWGMNSRTRVGVLQENPELKTLDEISFIDNLGKPGEKLYAARFIGNRGYLVTFRVTDPLYMLDFTTPEFPKVLGELEIDGYSDYLHPIGENYLLGIGKDAVPDTSASDFAGRGAWYQGLKLSLFDVSDANNLKEVQSIIIGKRGSSSALLGNHHALAWLASDTPDKFRLAIPVDEHSTQNEWSNYSQPSAFYDWTQTGAYVFAISTDDTPGIELSGRLITESLSSGDQPAYSHDDRIVLQGNTLHFIHDNSVFSSAVDDLQ